MRERGRAGAARDLDPPHASFSSDVQRSSDRVASAASKCSSWPACAFEKAGRARARQIATQGRIFFQLAEIVWDAEHVRHQDVGDGEARGGEPFAAFEHPFELIET